MIKIYYTESAMSEIVRMYGEILDVIQNESQGLLDYLIEQYYDHPTEGLKSVINYFVDNFNEHLKENIIEVFKTWESLENDFYTSARYHDVGEASENIALKTQRGLEDQINERLKSFRKFEKDLPINGNPNFITADLEGVKEIIVNLECQKSFWLDRIETRRVDNGLYGNFEEIAKATFVCVISLYKNIVLDLKNIF